MLQASVIKCYSVPNRTDHDGQVWYRELSDMAFVDAQNGWAVGSSQLVRTCDGGVTWANQFADAKVSRFILPVKVAAPCVDSAWIIDRNAAAEYRCCNTSDSGATWSGVIVEADCHPTDVWFIDPEHGWVAGDDGRCPGSVGRVYVTRDGGRTWDSCLSQFSGMPTIVRFVDSRNGWLVERRIESNRADPVYALHATDDGGECWVEVQVFSSEILSIYTSNSSCVIAADELGGIVKSCDGGHSWTPARRGKGTAINALAGQMGGVVVAGGDDGLMLVSFDCGDSWEATKLSRRVGNIVSVCVASVDSGVLASARGIYRYEIERGHNR